jgi:hypothetical protein
MLRQLLSRCGIGRVDARLTRTGVWHMTDINTGGVAGEAVGGMPGSGSMELFLPFFSNIAYAIEDWDEGPAIIPYARDGGNVGPRFGWPVRITHITVKAVGGTEGVLGVPAVAVNIYPQTYPAFPVLVINWPGEGGVVYGSAPCNVVIQANEVFGVIVEPIGDTSMQNFTVTLQGEYI